MQIEFVAGPLAADISPVARIVDQAALPADLDPVLVESARAPGLRARPASLTKAS